METFVLLFLLTYAGGDEETRGRLRSLLDFYRENRELITALTQNQAPMSETAPHVPPKEECDPQKNRPPEGVGDMDVLLRYLGGLH